MHVLFILQQGAMHGWQGFATIIAAQCFGWHVLGILLFLGSSSPSVSAEPKYQFSKDWVNRGGRVRDWMSALRPYQGKAGVHALEIGSFEGLSAIWFLDNILTNDSSTITCVDIFPAGYGDVFDRNIAASGRAKRVVKKTGLSSQVLRSLKRNSYDFIYVDGCHEAACVYLDAALSWDLLKVGGTLIFDDYVWELGKPAHGRPKLAIDAFVESFAPFIDVHQTNNHSLILRKTRDSLDAEDVSGIYQDMSRKGRKRAR